MTPTGPTPFSRIICGSVVVLRRRCGPLMLTPDQIEPGRTAVARYSAAQTKLDEQASAELDAMITFRAAPAHEAK
ncbi:hypothetical protein ACTXJG_16960 [Glutamicibacter arilaitensis]|uniref:hypothetical protein n=1 Tax=Glutamicibacter arilaitensis TaxID=256701 RepID=UPI003FD10F7B